MQLTIHCQVYWPDNSAVAQMITALAEDSAKAGYAVTVITSTRGYNIEQTYSPFETREHVKIIRVGGANFARHSIFGRLANHFSFLLFSGLKLLRLPKPDCLLVTTVPPFSLLLAVLILFGWRTPFVYVIEDFYPEIAFISGYLNRDSLCGRMLRHFFGWMTRQASAVIVLGDYMKKRVTEAHPQLNKDSIYSIHNWQDGALIFPRPRHDEPTVGVLFQYSGNLGEAHDFVTLLDAIKSLPGELHVQFEFIGRGKQRNFLEAAIAESQLAHCHVKDYVPQELLNESLNRAHVCLVTLKRGYEGLIVPSKIYGIMAAGKPVIFIGALDGEIPSLIRQHEIGWFVEQGDVAELVRVIRIAVRRADLREQFGRNAYQAFSSHYERSLATEKYIHVFDSVTKRVR